MDALVESLTDPPFVHALLHRAHREPLAAPADEDRAFLEGGALRTLLAKLLAEFREAVVGFGKTIEEGRLCQEHLGNHVAGLISEQVRGNLGSELKRFSDHLEPALQGLFVHAVGLLDDTVQDLMSTAEARLEANSTYGQERRNAFLELIESGCGESKAVAPDVSDENRARG